jgi:hypothetical protein
MSSSMVQSARPTSKGVLTSSACLVVGLSHKGRCGQATRPPKDRRNND